jgi:hypothetical protein
MPEEPRHASPPSAPTGSARRAPFGGHLPTVFGLLVAIGAVAVYVHFFLVKAPPPASGPKVVARLTAVEGSVRVKVAGVGPWTVGKSGRELRTGDVVQTDMKAGAAITFLSGNVVTVRQDTVVLISEGDAAVAREATAWHVQSGSVNFDLKQRTEIVTSTTRTTTSADATGSINVTDEGATGVKIFKGSAEVATKSGQTVTLAGNEAVLVDKQGGAGPRIALPPAPTLAAPHSQAELPYVAPPDPSVHLSWNAVSGAATYQVAMDYNVKQAELLLSAALESSDITGTDHAMTGLDPGNYFWRVAGVTREGLEGEFSQVSIFAVVPAVAKATGAPPLEARTADLESIVEVAGRTDPGAQITVDGHPAKVLPDGRFREHFRKTGRSVVVIRATGADGQFTEETLPVAAP